MLDAITNLTSTNLHVDESMVIQLGRDICGDLHNAEQREWLVTNGIGGYACGTLSGMLTRHYHGLLIAALKPPLERTLLLTKLDETVHYADQSYALYCDRWGDGSIPSHGYRYIERFHLDGSIPVWEYAIGDALLEKRIWMQQGENTTYIQYALTRASEPLTLQVKALVNYRDHSYGTHIQPETESDWQMEVKQVDQCIQITAFDDAVSFYLMPSGSTTAPIQQTISHTWYHNYRLAIERYRGIDPTDDHLHAATFELQLQPGQTWMLVASTHANAEKNGAIALAKQKQFEQDLIKQWQQASLIPNQSATASKASQGKLFQDLEVARVKATVLAANQFVVQRPLADGSIGQTVIAGYPWFGDWGRDTMISLPGLAIATGRPEIARPILLTFAAYIDQGMLPNVFPEVGATPHYNTVDATLWYFEAIRSYYNSTDDIELVRQLFPALADIIRWHQKGTRYNIKLDQDGLIYAGAPDVQLTWMDAKVDGWVVTPRIGKPVEINALWYNALCIMAQFAALIGESPQPYRQLAEQTRQGFQRFWSDELGYCYDVLDTPNGNDASLRPNQIFAVSLPTLTHTVIGRVKPLVEIEPLLQPHQQKALLDQVSRFLLTSHGLRSLAPNQPDYHGIYSGNLYQRDAAYHQGTVWGWLIGPYAQAHWQVYGDPAIARRLLEPLLDHLYGGCVGNMSEIFDGDSPFKPRGAFAQAWTVAEVLRVWSLLSSEL